MMKMIAHKKIFWFILAIGIALRVLSMIAMPLADDERINIYSAKQAGFYFTEPATSVVLEYYPKPFLSWYVHKLGLNIFGDNKIGGRFFNSLLGIATLLLGYFFVKRNFGTKEATLAMFLFAVNTFLVTHATMVGEEAPLLFFSLATIFLFTEAIDKKRFLLSALSGVAIGLAWLAKEHAFLLLPPIFIWSIISKERIYRVRHFAVFLLSFSLVVFPHILWLVINSRPLHTAYRISQLSLFSLTGVHFYLFKPISFLAGNDYRMMASWEWPLLDPISGMLLFVLPLLGFMYLKNDKIKLLLVCFCTIIAACSLIVEGEPWWAQLSIIPAICLAAVVFTNIIKNAPKMKWVLSCIVAFMFFNSFLFINDLKENSPPHRFAPFVDCNYDLLEEFYLKENKVDLAIEEAKRQLKICPNEVRGFTLLGEAYYAKRNYRKAAQQWIIALNIEPDYKQARLLFEQNLENIILSIKNLDSRNRGADDLHVLGSAYSYQGFYVKAEKTFNESIARDPDNPWGYFYLAKLYLSHNKYEEAVTSFARSIELSPQSYLLHYYLGKAYEGAKSYDQAILSFSESISLNPDYYRGYLGLGRIYDILGEEDKALRFIEKGKSVFHESLKNYYVEYYDA